MDLILSKTACIQPCFRAGLWRKTCYPFFDWSVTILFNFWILFYCTSHFFTIRLQTSFLFNLLLGVGKTSLVHLIVKGSSIARPSQTIGCTVDVKARLTFFYVGHLGSYDCMLTLC